MTVMRGYRIEILTENAAFAENPNELSDILRRCADRIEAGDETRYTLLDSCGNIVGFAGPAQVQKGEQS